MRIAFNCSIITFVTRELRCKAGRHRQGSPYFTPPLLRVYMRSSYIMGSVGALNHRTCQKSRFLVPPRDRTKYRRDPKCSSQFQNDSNTSRSIVSHDKAFSHES